MNTRNTRIKVKRTDLITKLKTTKNDQETTHAKAVTKYESERAKSNTRIINSIKALLSQMETNPDSVREKLSTGYRGVTEVELGELNLPNEPVLNTVELDRMIRILEASCDDTIGVGVGDNYAKYL